MLVDAVRQAEEAIFESMSFSCMDMSVWRDVEEHEYYEYVGWVSPQDHWNSPRYPPPLPMRLRCWRDVRIATRSGKEIRAHVEGLRDGEVLTVKKVFDNWQQSDSLRHGESVDTFEVEISRRQPRPRDSWVDR